MAEELTEQFTELKQLVSERLNDDRVREKAFDQLYEELRQLAAARMANERPDHTLQATALVHEAYVRLVDTKKAQQWASRGHFFAAAAEAMRRILIDAARRKTRSKHGGDLEQEELSDSMLQAERQLAAV